MRPDPGFFGPESITWRVNREMTVLFGGARSLLLNAAHPLVAAGARQTGGYRRDPWQRLLRTLRLQNMVTFGIRAEAVEAAAQINRLHRAVHGVDPVTGKRYDALDPDLLLWVHAGLVESSLLYYELTVAPLTGAERQAYHEEAMVAAELVLLPRRHIPPTFEGLRAYLREVVDSGELRATEVAGEVAELILRGAVPRSIRPIWKFVALAAMGTLPEGVRRLYGFPWGSRRRRLLEIELALLRRIRPFLPKPLRIIAPARWAEERMRPRPGLRLADLSRRGDG